MSTRRIALNALSDIIDRGAYANLCLKRAEQGLSERDAKWVSAAVYCTLDHLMMIDRIIASHAKGKLDKTIRNILRLGVCQAKYMNVPDSAACNESVRLAKEVGKGALSGYVNGVMRSVCRDTELPPLPDEPVERLSVEYSWPKWLADELVADYGIAEAEGIMAQQTHDFCIRAQWPYTADELACALNDRGIGFRRGKIDPNAFCLENGFNVEKEPLFTDGKITVQSESAMLVCRAIEPKAGMRILDACCAPGGKTAYMASLAKNGCSITGFELHEHRRELTLNTLKRLNVENAEIVQKDASVYDEVYCGAFDAVLVDAPCSGLGVRGKPDVRYAKTSGMIDALSELQLKILNTCARYVKIGGTLVYSTCTVSRRENIGVWEQFLVENCNYAPGNMENILPHDMRSRAEGGRIQLLPQHDGTEGFFIAKFIRRR